MAIVIKEANDTGEEDQVWTNKNRKQAESDSSDDTMDFEALKREK